MIAVSLVAVLSSAFAIKPAMADVSVGANISIPFTNGMINISVGDLLYGFYEGRFYRPTDHGRYRPVAAPVGAIVPSLPRGYSKHSDRYQYGDIYYQQAPNGYRVVNNPTQTVIRSPNKERHDNREIKSSKFQSEKSNNGHGAENKGNKHSGRRDQQDKRLYPHEERH